MGKKKISLLVVTIVSRVYGQEFSSCRAGVKLTLFSEEVRFNVAVQLCADLGAIIAPANSEEENNQLIALADESQNKDGIWIGT